MTSSFVHRPRGRYVQQGRQGFTLLEVILAIGLLTLGLAAILRINQMSYNNIRAASDGLHAEMVAETVLSELMLGSLPIENYGPVAVDSQIALGDWQYQIIKEPTIAVELAQVRVLVGRNLGAGERPDCEVVRWFPDPDYRPVAPATATSAIP
jgi:type II secretion system protein I